MALATGLAGCDDPTNSVALQLNLDRPVDVAFTCYGGLRLTGTDGAQAADPVTTSAQPISACDLRAQPRLDTDAVKLPPGQEDLTAMGGAALDAVDYYGLILQSGPGTVAVARFPAERVSTYNGNETTILDTDPLTPSKNSISVGTRPVAIVTDPTGCFAVTANAGSCDLSALDVNSALQFDGQAKVTRLTVRNGAGAEIKARPAAMVAAPGSAVVGQACPANPTGLVYVAYPTCNLVAAVKLDATAGAATATVVSGISYASGLPVLIDPSMVRCADECGTNPAPTTNPQPSALDLVRDARPATERLAIGARNSNQLTMVELEPATSLPKAMMPISQIALSPGAGPQLGVLDVALSPQIGMGGMDGLNNDATGPQFQFVYAVATDGTVRVASTLAGNARECDTQIDPRAIHDVTDLNVLSCIPVGSHPRRAGASGPGIRVPGDGVPSAANIFRAELPLVAAGEARAPVAPTRLNGYFGVITSTTGATYVVDIDDDDRPDAEVPGMPLTVDLAVSLPHQLRDQVAERNAVAETVPEGQTAPVAVCNSNGPGVDENGALRGGPRLTGAFNRLTLPEVVSQAKVPMLPNLRHLQCTGADTATSGPVSIPELSFSAPPAEREARFPDTRALASTEDWRFVWEGALSGDSIVQDNNGPVVRVGSVKVNGASMSVNDGSRPYCAAGVEPFDIVQLRGCDPTSTTNQCPFNTRCFLHPESATGVGVCIPEKATSSYIETCRDYLVSVRRYTVNETPEAGKLALLPRIRELRSTPLTGCTSNEQCTALATYEARQATDRHPFEDTTMAARSYRCMADASRKGNLPRCMMTCTRDSDCDSASSCDEAAGVCMEGPIPPAECVVGVQRYELRAAEAFTVLGSASGYVHPIVKEAASDRCVKSTAPADKLKLGRIPLVAPPCGADDATSPNPCLKTVEHYETRAPFTFDAGQNACIEGTSASTRRDTQAVWFRSPGLSLHIVDPTYPGDLQCRGDRLGFMGTPLVDVPMAFTGLAFTFRQNGGHAPLPLRTSAVVPVRVVRGPQQSIWIIDEGDFLSEAATTPSTRGKVFRIESSALGVINVMQ